MNWGDLIDERLLAGLLPSEHRRLAKPVKESLCLFLSSLSPRRQQILLDEQLALPLTASLSVRLGKLAQGSPVLQKLGQTLAREPRLSLELRRELQQLESLPPQVSLPEIESTLRSELGDLAARGVRLDPPAIAEASVAVVIPFSQFGGAAAEPSSPGVFKLLKPNIEAILEEELDQLESVGSLLDEKCHELQIPHLDYEDSFRQVRQKLLCELQLEREQQHLRDAQAFYQGDPQVQIPTVLEHCSSRVTAMQRVTGGKITDASFESDDHRRRLAVLVTRALLSRPIFAAKGNAIFHGDPHAGNLFRTSDGRLAILDWSLVGTLPEPEHIAINQIMLAAITLRGRKICRELEGIAERRQVDRVALKRVVARWLHKLRRGDFPGLDWLIGLLDDATQSAKLRVSTDMMLFRKSLLSINGVLHELGACGSHNDRVLLTDFMRHLGKEWLDRWTARPTSREFRTRLSNADLTETMLHFPWTMSRFWLEESCDIARNFARIAREQSSTTL